VTDVLATTRCPRCAALVRPGQDWCTLCHTDLRPAPEPPAVPLSERHQEGLSAEVADPDPLTTPDLAALGPVEQAGKSLPLHGKHARHAASATESGPGSGAAALDDETIQAMLAQLAQETDDPLALVAGRFDSRAAKVAFALGVCVVSIAVLFLGAVVLTAIFG
jgi:hypothetical protein